MEAKPFFSRVIDAEIGEPKGVGKTATAARLAATVRRLDVPAERSVVAANPEL
jgi:hypothetical protein